MLRDFVWKAFEDTGDIEKYVFYKEIEEKCREQQERKRPEREKAAFSL